VLEEATARRLTEFAAAGGLVIAIGALPEHGVGDPGGAADAALARLRPLCRFVESADDLGSLLNQVVRVEAPVPSLVREVDGATVIFLPAASPGASRISVERPEQRGADLGWLDVTYDFDPGRYTSQMRVRVRGVSGRPLVVSPFGGPARPLPYERKGDVTELVVPFDDGPAALLVFTDAPVADPHVREPESRPTPTDETDLGHRWEMELIPTLDNTWGDFARPAGELPALSRWAVRHRIERHGEDGLRDGWAAPASALAPAPASAPASAPADSDDDAASASAASAASASAASAGDASAGDGSGWAVAHATFGSHGRWKGPGEPDWRPAVYSASRGIHKDPVHRDTLGPKGHVPEEFLDFGEIGAGQAVLYRAALTVPESGFLAVGAAAAKTAWVDGTQVALDDWGYLAIAPDRLPPGRHVLDLRLVPEEDGWLRAHVAIVGDPERYRRPEWITVGGSAAPGAEIMLTEVISPGAGPTLQVASAMPCRVLVNGVEVGRQGGFDPYAEQAVPRAGRYDVTHALRPGNNELKLALTEGERAPSVLVDGCAVSGRGWRATRDGAEVPVLPVRRQHGDPAALHLRRRPHPLPGAAWLEDDGHDETVLPVVFADPGSDPDPDPDPDTDPALEDRVEWLRFMVPPGATRMELAVHGDVTVFVDGQQAATAAGTPARLVVDLAGASGDAPAVRSAALRIRTLPGFTAGAALAGPVEFGVGTGVIELGDWQDVGLAEYSGGVRYRTRVERQQPFSNAVIDLGAVRGTAEVIVNGRSVGIRVCAPYTFEVTQALGSGANEIEVLVFGTLAPYLDAASPTHFVFSGQRVSGLMGPVRLRWSSLG
jgi:hypothetical protein